MYIMALCKGITYRSLIDQSVAFPLTKFKSILESIFVGNLAIYTKGDYVNISCKNMLKELDLDDITCIYIRSKVLSLPCFGIYTGIIITSFLERLITYLEDLTDIYNFTLNLEQIKLYLSNCVEQMKVESEMDVAVLVDSVTCVLAIELCLPNISLKKLSLEIVKTVVFSMESGTSKLGRIHVIVERGKECFLANKGVICQVDDTNMKIVNTLVDLQSDILHYLLLIVEPMSDDFKILFEHICNHNVKIVICQKSISDYNQILLRRKGILAIEKVGENIALSIEQLTSAIPVSDLNFVTADLVKMLGTFNKINILPMENRHFITIEKGSSSVCSLFVSCRLLGQTGGPKEIIDDCVQLVFSMIRQPFLLPGPLIFEQKIVQFLLDKSATNPIEKQCISWLVDILKTISDLNETLLSKLPDCKKKVDDPYFLKKNVLSHAIDGIIEIVNIGIVIEKKS